MTKATTTMADESESSSPRSPLANPRDEGEGARSSSGGGGEEGTPPAASSAAGDAGGEAKPPPPAEQREGAEDGKQGGVAPHLGVEIERHPSSRPHNNNNKFNNGFLPPQETNPPPADFRERRESNARDARRGCRAPPSARASPSERSWDDDVAKRKAAEREEDDVAKKKTAAREEDGVADARPSNFDEEQDAKGNNNNYDASKMSTSEDPEVDAAEAGASARMEEASAAGGAWAASSEKDGSDGSPPLPEDARGDDAIDDESQESRVVGAPQDSLQARSQPASQGDEQEHHDEGDSPAAENNVHHAPGNNTRQAARATTSRRRVGAFRIFPDARRVEQVGRSLRIESPAARRRVPPTISRGDDRDDESEAGGATAVHVPEASLVDHRYVVEAEPIHLTHVPISSIEQQRGENEDGNESGPKKNVEKISWGLLIICLLAAVAAGVGLGTRDKGNVSADETLGGFQSEEEEVPGTAGEEEGRVQSTEGLESLIASQDTQVSDIPPMIWEQVGSSIPGVSPKNRAGFAVASSSDGTIVAIGSAFNDEAARDAGHVRVFAWNSTASDWSQRGSTLLGEAEGGQFGNSVALSGSGDTLVCGAPFHDDDSGQVKVFKWNETVMDYVVWGSLHNRTGDAWEQWGYDIDISEDGSRVAVGAPVNLEVALGNPKNTDLDDPAQGERWLSFARVFDWNTTIMDWSPTGNFLGDQVGDYFGHSVSLSADGATLAVGAISYDGAGGEDNIGKTRVWKWDGEASDWLRLGGGIYGENAGDGAGWSTDLSADGRTLAVSALLNDGAGGEESGHVRVYSWDESASDWARMGSDIDGGGEFDRLGAQVSLAADGRTVAATSVLNSDNGLWAGHCRVFRWSDKARDWVQVGQDIQGKAADKTRGVALSGDGGTVVVGAWGASTATGYVRIFNSSQLEGDEHDVFK